MFIELSILKYNGEVDFDNTVLPGPQGLLNSSVTV